MTESHPIFCGKCGTPNPADNLYCRKCGHRLAEDVVEGEETFGNVERDPEPPAAPIEGVELQSFPLVDPKTGEQLKARPRRPGPFEEAAEGPAPRKGSIILRSIGIHTLAITLLGLASFVVFSASDPATSETFSQAELSSVLDLFARLERGEVTQEQAGTELQGLLPIGEDALLRLQLLTHGFALLGFFLSGLICAKLWKPQRLMDVGMAAVIVGGFLSLCFCNPVVWILGFVLCLSGAALGRRWK